MAGEERYHIGEGVGAHLIIAPELIELMGVKKLLGPNEVSLEIHERGRVDGQEYDIRHRRDAGFVDVWDQWYDLVVDQIDVTLVVISSDFDLFSKINDIALIANDVNKLIAW